MNVRVFSRAARTALPIVILARGPVAVAGEAKAPVPAHGGRVVRVERGVFEVVFTDREIAVYPVVSPGAPARPPLVRGEVVLRARRAPPRRFDLAPLPGVEGRSRGLRVTGDFSDIRDGSRRGEFEVAGPDGRPVTFRVVLRRPATGERAGSGASAGGDGEGSDPGGNRAPPAAGSHAGSGAGRGRVPQTAGSHAGSGAGRDRAPQTTGSHAGSGAGSHAGSGAGRGPAPPATAERPGRVPRVPGRRPRAP